METVNYELIAKALFARLNTDQQIDSLQLSPTDIIAAEEGELVWEHTDAPSGWKITYLSSLELANFQRLKRLEESVRKSYPTLLMSEVENLAVNLMKLAQDS